MSEPARDLDREARLKKARVMVAGSERAPNPEKNMKGEKPKWHTESLCFDKDGCLFVKNPELAKEIHSAMKAWGNRLRIYTWVASKREAMDYADDGKSGGTGTTSEAGHPVNMMCPCAPEG